MAQRVTGMGFALAVSPPLVLLLGPFDGVLVVNLCSVVSAAMVLSRVWRRVEWRRFGQLVVSALVLGVIPGAWLVTILDTWVLEIGIAVLLLVALAVSQLITRTDFVAYGPLSTTVAGAASGFMNVTAGFGGAAVSAYAVISRWPQQSFAATIQPYFLTLGAASLTAKLLFAEGIVVSLELWQWLVIIVALVIGVALGEVVVSHISYETARRAVIAIAYVGGVVTLAHGLATADISGVDWFG